MAFANYTFIELDTVDSTNNYAMQLIDDDKAQQGLTITAAAQLGGKGQRGRTWTDEPGKNLLMSIISMPNRPLHQQFTFSAAIAVAIANVLQNMLPNHQVHIKWPNDIIINDKKAGGILIENVLIGSKWSHAVIGLGLNVNQSAFPPHLPTATSLLLTTLTEWDLSAIKKQIHQHIMAAVLHPAPEAHTLQRYNNLLYKINDMQLFSIQNHILNAKITGVSADGTIRLRLPDGQFQSFAHGTITWVW